MSVASLLALVCFYSVDGDLTIAFTSIMLNVVLFFY